MKKSVRIALITAGALVLAGCILIGAALFSGIDFSLDRSFIAYSIIPGTNNYKSYSNDFSETGEYQLSTSGITGIHIDWIAGNVEVSASDLENSIAFTEYTHGKSAPSEDVCLTYGVSDGILFIQYCGINPPANLPGKTLSIVLPSKFAGVLERLTVESASANVTVSSEVSPKNLECSTSSGSIIIQDANCVDVDLSTASGDIYFQGYYNDGCISTASGNISVAGTGQSLAADSASGDITISGTTHELELDSASGDVFLNCEQCPDELNIETTSGDIIIHLPSQSSFALEFGSVSGDLDSAFPLARKDGMLICGDGGSDFEIDTTSGDISLLI